MGVAVRLGSRCRAGRQPLRRTVFAQNPFAWVGVAPGKHRPSAPPGRTSGKIIPCPARFIRCAWRGRPVAGYGDAKNGLLVRWSSAHDIARRWQPGALYKLVNGVRTLLASAPGGFIPGQWYRMAITSSFDGIRVVIDHSERIAINDRLASRRHRPLRRGRRRGRSSTMSSPMAHLRCRPRAGDPAIRHQRQVHE